MALTIQQKSNFSNFPKPAELIEIRETAALEASDRVLINTLYRRAHDAGSMDQPTASWSIPMADLNAGTHESNDRLRASLKRLLGVQVTVTHQDSETGEETVLQTVLFTHFSSPASGPGNLEYGIPDKLRAVLAKSSRWGRIKAEIVHAMSSKYAIALYELLRLRANLKYCSETIPIDRFRALLGVPPGTYENGTNFLNKVINPAVLEVNGLSELNCSVKFVRDHTRAPITAVVLGWWEKSTDENRAAIRELNSSKAGRKARLRDQVETIQTQEAIA